MAETLEKGKQRLKRSYKTKDIESTSEADNQKLPEPLLLSSKQLHKAFKDVMPMPKSLSPKKFAHDIGLQQSAATEEERNYNEAAAAQCKKNI